MNFERYSQTTPASIEMVEAELRAAQERGYHQSQSEYIPDLAGVSLPLKIGDRALAIVVAGPLSRCLARRQETAALIKRAIAAHAGSASTGSAAVTGASGRGKG